MAAALARVARPRDRKLTILVATSGDTGGAVAARVPPASVGRRRPALSRQGLVSPRQAQQLACWGDNVRTFAVRGTFDDCQRMVKEAFRDPALAATLRALVGEQHQRRAAAAADGRTTRRRASRSGIAKGGSAELHRAVRQSRQRDRRACWAREPGLPIGDIVLATNANRTVTEFLDSGAWRPRASVATLASAMDVGNPSNMERLRALFPDRPPRSHFRAAGHRRPDPRHHPAGCRGARTTSGIRTARPRRTCITTLRRGIASTSRGCWSRPRIPRSSTRSSSR